MEIVLEDKESLKAFCEALSNIKGVRSVTYGTDDFLQIQRGYVDVDLKVKEDPAFITYGNESGL